MPAIILCAGALCTTWLAMRATVALHPSAFTAAEAFLPMALSLIFAAPIWIGQRLLGEQAQALHFEMELACFDLGTALKLNQRQRTACQLAVDAAERAATQRAAVARLEHTRGLNALAAVPVTSLFAGYLEVANGILNSFNNWGEAMMYLALAGALKWLALGLAIAILVWLMHRWLREQSQQLDHEMAVACHDLAAALWAAPRNLAK